MTNGRYSGTTRRQHGRLDIHGELLAYSANTRRWLVGSSLPAWNALDMIKIARPVRNVIDPILSKGRSD